jgi:hypothetical protein
MDAICAECRFLKKKETRKSSITCMFIELRRMMKQNFAEKEFSIHSHSSYSLLFLVELS